MSRPGSDMASISCEAVDDTRMWEHEITENGVQVALPTMLKEHLSFLLE